jgi:hypothetical protein
MFVAWVDAHLKTDFEGPDCQEGAGRVSRFKTASSPFGQSLDPLYGTAGSGCAPGL